MATVLDVANRQTGNDHSWHTPDNLPASGATQMDLDKKQVPDSTAKIPNGTSAVANTGGSGDWVIQKFGGTSVGKFALNIVDQVIGYCSCPPPLRPLEEGVAPKC